MYSCLDFEKSLLPVHSTAVDSPFSLQHQTMTLSWHVLQFGVTAYRFIISSDWEAWGYAITMLQSHNVPIVVCLASYPGHVSLLPRSWGSMGNRRELTYPRGTSPHTWGTNLYLFYKYSVVDSVT